MKVQSKAGLLVAAAVAAGNSANTVMAHGGHASGPKEGETIQDYAQRHMAREHHIDAFDIPSFFHLHDLNSDGVWSPDEIEAIYGVHHPYSKDKSSGNKEHDAKAKTIVDAVLKAMDRDGNGYITLHEFEATGLAGLPDFSSLGAEGHHYDVESEFFLHHEEEFHNTPETQTDDSYNHPEDLEHFAHHDKIELEEKNKERAYQGLPPLDKLEAENEAAMEAAIKRAMEEAQAHIEAEQRRFKEARNHPEHITPMDGSGHVVPESPPSLMDQPNPRYIRTPKKPGVDDTVKHNVKEAKEKPGYGEGPDGYKRPKSQSDKMRRNLPYKYKFRRSWGDF